MQHQARGLARQLVRPAVELVAQHGMARGVEMDAHLMAAAGARGGLDEGRAIAERLHRANLGGGGLAVGPHSPAAGAEGTEGLLEQARRAPFSGHQGAIALLDAAALEEGAKLLVRRGVLGEQERAARVSVEAMDDEEPEAEPPEGLIGR